MNEHLKHLPCKQLVTTLSDYVDGTLDDTLCVELERHMQDCENCRIVVDTIKKTIELYHSTQPTESVPPDVRERLFARLNLDQYLKKK